MTYDRVCITVMNSQINGEQDTFKSSSANHLDEFHPITIIAPDAVVSECPLVRNTFVGGGARVHGSTVANTIVLSTSALTSTISDSHVVDSILSPGCSVTRNSLVDKTFLFEHSCVDGAARVSESILGPDSGVAGGECSHSLLGPLAGFHHASLLIGAVWPLGRGNLSYGCMVGANHTGRVSDQECWLGEGCFFGLGSKVKFPFNALLAPYSLFASGVVCLPQVLALPFSLVVTPSEPLPAAVSPACNVLKPGWVLEHNPYMLER